MKKKNLFVRSKNNPILTVNDLPYEANSVFNAGAAIVKGKFFLLLRVEDCEGFSHFIGAYSQDGITDWQIDLQSKFTANAVWGVEDPRLTFLPGLGIWAVTYTHYSPGGAAVGLAITKDFRDYDQFGIILPPENKDAALFSEPIQGKWWMIHRPFSQQKNMWLACAPAYSLESLRYWGDHQLLIKTDSSPRWDGHHLGLNAPPLKTEYGWLISYHGVKRNSSGPIYRMGLALLDTENPTKVTHRTKEPVMAPKENYEVGGDVDKVIFSCGWVVDQQNNLRLYYGAADTCIGLAVAPLEEVIKHVLENPV